MTPEELQILKYVYEQQKVLETATIELRDANRAAARAVTNLAGGLQSSETRQQRDDRALVKLIDLTAEMQQSLERLIETRDARTMTAQEMADLIGTEGFETICLVRQILWKRKHDHRGQALPLPPPPHDLVPTPYATAAPVVEEHLHRRAGDTAKLPVHKHRRKDDSISMRTQVDAEGRTWLKTFIQWKMPTKKEWVTVVVPWLGLLATAIWRAFHVAP